MEGRGVAGAQEEEHSRQIFLIPGEVLGDHAGLRQFPEGHQSLHPVVKLRGIEHGGIAVVHVHVDGAAGVPLHGLSGGDDARPHGVEHVVGKGPQTALQAGVVRDHVAHGPALEQAEFQQTADFGGQRRLHGRDLPVKFHSGSHGIQPLVGLGNMGRTAVNIHLHLAGPAHHFLFPAGDDALFQTGPEMQGENCLHMVVPEHMGPANIPGPAGGLLRRLEHQQHVMAKLLLAVQPPGQFQQNRHVAVVAAGVHLAGMGRCVGGLSGLLHGQGVRIGAESDGAGLTVVKPGAKRPLHGGKHLTFQAGQGVFQIFHGFGQVPVQLRDPVEGTTVLLQWHRIAS